MSQLRASSQLDRTALGCWCAHDSGVASSSHGGSGSGSTIRHRSACRCEKAGRRSCCRGWRTRGQQHSSPDLWSSCLRCCCCCAWQASGATANWRHSAARAHFRQRHSRLSANARRAGAGADDRTHSARGGGVGRSGNEHRGSVSGVRGCGCSLLLMDVDRIRILVRDGRQGRRSSGSGSGSVNWIRSSSSSLQRRRATREGEGRRRRTTPHSAAGATTHRCDRRRTNRRRTGRDGEEGSGGWSRRRSSGRGRHHEDTVCICRRAQCASGHFDRSGLPRDR